MHIMINPPPRAIYWMPLIWQEIHERYIVGQTLNSDNFARLKTYLCGSKDVSLWLTGVILWVKNKVIYWVKGRYFLGQKMSCFGWEIFIWCKNTVFWVTHVIFCPITLFCGAHFVFFGKNDVIFEEKRMLALSDVI